MPIIHLQTLLREVLLLLIFDLSFCHTSKHPTEDLTNTLHTRNFFYIGGREVNVSTPSYGNGSVLTEQIYVEELSSASITHPYPLVFWTGLGQSGTNWLNTPDGRPGWSSYFLSKGYTVYIADQPVRGRSPYLPAPYNDTNTAQGVVTQPYASQFWTGTQYEADPLWPQAKQHCQWPGTGLPGDVSFNNFVAAFVPSLLNQTLAEELSRSALSALLQRVGPAILLTHSAGGPHGWVAADDHPDLVKAIVALEPQGPPFVNAVIRSSGPGIVRPYAITQTPIAYDPPIQTADDLANMTISSGVDDGSRSDCVLQASPPRRLTNISKVPVLLVTSEAGYHAVYDYCTVDYLKQAGVNVEWLNLPEAGIEGNGHFMFMEKNNLEIADMIEQWLP